MSVDTCGQHTSAYVSIRQHTSAYVSIWSAYVSIRQHTSAYVSICRALTPCPNPQALWRSRVAAVPLPQVRLDFRVPRAHPTCCGPPTHFLTRRRVVARRLLLSALLKRRDFDFEAQSSCGPPRPLPALPVLPPGLPATVLRVLRKISYIIDITYSYSCMRP